MVFYKGHLVPKEMVKFITGGLMSLMVCNVLLYSLLRYWNCIILSGFTGRLCVDCWCGNHRIELPYHRHSLGPDRGNNRSSGTEERDFQVCELNDVRIRIRKL